jgi:Raf kinase inhibitor-like YbhB/YbcL family protein
MSFVLTSPDLADGQTIPMKHVFHALGGQNLSPALEWSGAPEGTKSFAVTCYDPDAPTGSGWWHWTVFNLPASTTGLPGGVSADGAGLPPGAGQGRTDYGSAGWGGPYPPKGDKPHRYIFTVHALNTDRLDLDGGASGAMVGFNLHFATLARASFTALFGH